MTIDEGKRIVQARINSMWTAPPGASIELNLTGSLPIGTYYIGVNLRFSASDYYTLFERYAVPTVDEAVNWALDQLATQNVQWKFSSISTQRKILAETRALEAQAALAATPPSAQQAMAEVAQVVETHQAELKAEAEAARIAAEKAQQERLAEIEAERARQAALEAERRAQEQTAMATPACCGLVSVGGPVTTAAALEVPTVPTVVETVPVEEKPKGIVRGEPIPGTPLPGGELRIQPVELPVEAERAAEAPPPAAATNLSWLYGVGVVILLVFVILVLRR